MTLLEKRTMGCKANELAYVRRASSGSVKSAIGSRVAALRERVGHGTWRCSPVVLSFLGPTKSWSILVGRLVGLDLQIPSG